MPDYPMRFAPNRCPNCKDLASGVQEVVCCVAEISWNDEKDGAAYAGGSDVWFDTQATDETTDGKAVLHCNCGATWEAEILPPLGP